MAKKTRIVLIFSGAIFVTPWIHFKRKNQNHLYQLLLLFFLCTEHSAKYFHLK